MRIRMKINVSGTFHNIVEGVTAGQVVDIDDDEAQRYIRLGYAELANQGRLPRPPTVETAVAPSSTQERAVAPADVVVRSDEVAPSVTESEVVDGNPVKRVRRTTTTGRPVRRG